MSNNRTYYGSPGLSGMFTPGIKGLLIANLAVYALQLTLSYDPVWYFGLTPAMFWSQHALWQIVTYMFLHGGFTHIFFNMLTLWLFGGALESVWGTRRFLQFYFLTGVGAGLSNCILTPHLGIPIIGASGAVYGLLAAYGILFPDALIYVYFLFPIKAKYLVLIFGGIEFVSSLHPGASPVAHLVHLGGMAIGVIYLKWGSTILWTKRKWNERRREAEWKREEHHFTEEQQLRRELDDLLDKINEVGLENLTSWEKRRLREAGERLKQMEETKSG